MINQAVRDEMGRILAEIQDGTFAKEWVAENANGRPNFNALRQAGLDHPIEKVGAELRDMMPFVTAGRQKIQDVSGRLSPAADGRQWPSDGSGRAARREGAGPRADVPASRRPGSALAAGQVHPQRRRHHLVGVGEVAGLLARSPVPLALRPVGPGDGHPAARSLRAPT